MVLDMMQCFPNVGRTIMCLLIRVGSFWYRDVYCDAEDTDSVLVPVYRHAVHGMWSMH